LHHYLKGSSWEGFVIEQIEPLLPVGYGLYFYRTSHGNELDLVVARGIEIVLAIEIKMSGNPTLSRSNRLALEDLNNPPLLIVVPGNEILPIRPEVTICGLGQIEKQIAGICT
jgi:predicted AAA+ superfamily ATPase